MKGKSIGIAAAAVALILGATYFSANISKNKAEQNSSSTAAKDSQAEQQQLSNISVNPLLTYGDTDDERNYGYDVLYKHDGIKIMLLASRLDGDQKEIDISVQNDTAEDMWVKTEYVVPNCYISNAKMNELVEAGKTVETTISYINDCIGQQEKINDIELKFSLVGDDEDAEYSYSEQIKIIYDNAEHPNLPYNDETLVWEDGGFELYKSPGKTESDENGSFVRQYFYLRNTGTTDYYYSATHFFYDDKEEIANSLRAFEVVPAGCAYYINFKIRPNDPNDLERIKTIGFAPRLISLDDELETLYSGDYIKLDI